MWYLQSCSRPWCVCEIVLIPCVVGAVVALTVMRVLLLVCEASMLRECKCARVVHEGHVLCPVHTTC